MAKMYLTAWQESLAMLIGKDAPFQSKKSGEDDATEVKEFPESQTFHLVLQNFWAGHYERCIYYSERSSALSDIGQLKVRYMSNC